VKATAASDRLVGTATRRPRHRWGCRDGGAAGFERGSDRAVGAARATIGTRTRRGPDSAFMARRARGCGRVAATRRRCADERARRGEKEAARWDPQQ
jgi:hypothetical protein